MAGRGVRVAGAVTLEGIPLAEWPADRLARQEVIVAHRTQTLNRLDEVLVLDRGWLRPGPDSDGLRRRAPMVCAADDAGDHSVGRQ